MFGLGAYDLYRPINPVNLYVGSFNVNYGDGFDASGFRSGCRCGWQDEPWGSKGEPKGNGLGLNTQKQRGLGGGGAGGAGMGPGKEWPRIEPGKGGPGMGDGKMDGGNGGPGLRY